MAKKLVTVMWATSIEIDLPDEVNLENIQFPTGIHSYHAEKVIREAWCNIQESGGEITDIQDAMPDTLDEAIALGKFNKEANKK